MPTAKDNFKTLQILLKTLIEQEKMDDFDRDLEGWLDEAIKKLATIYGKDSTPVNYFQQINEAHLASTDEDGLIPKASESMTFEAARFHLEKFIQTFWEPDVRTDFSQLEHLKYSINQDIAALESQQLALNSATLSSWITTTKELMANRFGTHSSKYSDFAELKENFDQEYAAAKLAHEKETLKHDYFLRGRQRIIAIINQLKSELEQMNSIQPIVMPKQKGLLHSFQRISSTAWSIIVAVFIACVGGAYALGKDNSSMKFDKDKINLEKENDQLKAKEKEYEERLSKLRDSLTKAQDSIILLSPHNLQPKQK